MLDLLAAGKSFHIYIVSASWCSPCQTLKHRLRIVCDPINVKINIVDYESDLKRELDNWYVENGKPKINTIPDWVITCKLDGNTVRYKRYRNQDIDTLTIKELKKRINEFIQKSKTSE